MKTKFNIKTSFVKGKTRFQLFVGALIFVSASLASCNNNNGGKTTASHDISSVVSNRIDTMGSGSKQS